MVFFPMLPGIEVSFLAARLRIAGWMLLFATLGMDPHQVGEGQRCCVKWPPGPPGGSGETSSHFATCLATRFDEGRDLP